MYTANLTSEQAKLNIERNIHLLRQLKKMGYIKDNTLILEPNQLCLFDPVAFLTDNLADLGSFKEAISLYLEIVTYKNEASQNIKSFVDLKEYPRLQVAEVAGLTEKQINDFLITVMREYRKAIELEKNQVKKDAIRLSQQLEIPDGNEDRRQKFLEKKLDFGGSYKRDKKFQDWPINQFGDFPLYASMGPVAESFTLGRDELKTDINVRDFFLALFENEGTNIKHVVALGFAGVDFIDYFNKKNNAFTFTTKENKTIRIVLEQISSQSEIAYEHQGKEIKSNEFKLKLSCFEVNESDQSTPLKLIKEKEISLLNIITPDMEAITFNTDFSRRFHAQLIEAMKNGEEILVHCRAGLGRTGQIVAQLLAIYLQYEKQFFNEDNSLNKEAINKFVMWLREIRPGFLLIPEQVEQFLMTVSEHAQSPEKRKVEVAAKEHLITQIDATLFNKEEYKTSTKKRKIDDPEEQVQQTKSTQKGSSIDNT